MNTDFELTELEEEWFAAASAGKAEMIKLVDEVIESLRGVRAYRISDDYVARHLWDEFSWFANEGDLMDKFLPSVDSFVDKQLHTVDHERLVLLSAYSINALSQASYGNFSDADLSEELPLGLVSHHAIIDACNRLICAKANKRNVAILGHDGSDEVFFLAEELGGLCSELVEASEVADIIHTRLEAVISAKPALELLAEEIAEVCFEELADCVSEPVYSLLSKRSNRVKKTFMQDDIMPALVKTRTFILEALDPVETGELYI